MYLYNSVSHKKELFVPNNPELVKMYTCGPTVYHYYQRFCCIVRGELRVNNYSLKALGEIKIKYCQSLDKTDCCSK